MLVFKENAEKPADIIQVDCCSWGLEASKSYHLFYVDLFAPRRPKE